MGLQHTFRPLGPWTEGNTEDRRRRGTFKATWSDTLRLLHRELAYLDAENVVIQADFQERGLRLDGTGPRADARQPLHPGVRVAFDSRHGPLTYATDSCEFWQHNVRSIALGLEALRAVDRYGVTKSGEQYRGWAQLGPGTATPTGAAMGREDAITLIRQWQANAGAGPADLVNVSTGPEAMKRAFRVARATAHPDRRGGEGSFFVALEQAGRTLGLIT